MCLICDRIKAIKAGSNPYFVAELETGYVVLGDHQHFRGYSLFLCKEHAAELWGLSSEIKLKFLSEMTFVAEAVQKAFGAEKVNCELLGNVDAHLHWHLFPRQSGDLDGYENGRPSGPVWWYPRDKMYAADTVLGSSELDSMREALLQALEELDACSIIRDFRH